jgi:hypothetical protein
VAWVGGGGGGGGGGGVEDFQCYHFVLHCLTMSYFSMMFVFYTFDWQG